MKGKILLIPLILYGFQWFRHQFAYIGFVMLNKNNLLANFVDIQTMNITGSLYMIIIVLCLGFLYLINKENKRK